MQFRRFFRNCLRTLLRRSQLKRPTERATTSARRDFLNERIEQIETDFNEADRVGSIEEMIDKLRNENIPSGFIIHQDSGIVYLLNLNLASSPPQITGSIIVHQNMKFEIYELARSIPANRFKHITTSDVINRVSILEVGLRVISSNA